MHDCQQQYTKAGTPTHASPQHTAACLDTRFRCPGLTTWKVTTIAESHSTAQKPAPEYRSTMELSYPAGSPGLRGASGAASAPGDGSG